MAKRISSDGNCERVQVDTVMYQISELASRIVTLGSFAGIYGLMLICLSAVLILASFLGSTEDSRPSHIIYPHVYNMIEHGLGAIFILVLYISLVHKKRKAVKQEAEEILHAEHELQSGIENSAFETDVVSDPSHFSGECLGIAIKGLTIEELRKRYVQIKPVTFDSEGISFFSRMGLLAFGLGATLLDGARLMQYNNNPGVWDCYGGWYFASCCVNIAYLWLMMFFVLKFHNAVINFSYPVIKFGLSHLIASNIGIWITTVVLEGYTYTVLTNETTNNTQDYGKIRFMGCIMEQTVRDVVSPFLYPFAIEFSLLAAANIYRILRNVGCIVVHKRTKQSEEKLLSTELVDCHKAHTGLFYGFIIFLGIVCATVLYMYYDTNSEHESLPGHPGIDITHFIYMITGISANLIGIATMFPTAWKLRALHFNGQLDCALDMYLLVTGVLGYYMMFGLVGMASIHRLYDHGPTGTVAKLLLALCVLEYVQGTMLVIILVDGLHRRAGMTAHGHEKPGRSLVTFHIVLNMGLWIVNTFLLKGLHHLELLSEFYGEEVWGVMVRVFLPLSIFFRFHTAVCFAEIWQNAYKMEKSSTIRFLEVAQKIQETFL